jgi:hypothetical protein
MCESGVNLPSEDISKNVIYSLLPEKLLHEFHHGFMIIQLDKLRNFLILIEAPTVVTMTR